MAAAILICDDDPDMRMAMKRTLRGYNITEVGSPAEALEVMKTKTFDAVISDFSLDADRDGLDVLQHVRVSHPDTIRFLVTANREMDVAVRAVNEGAVHKFFLKPWSDDKLRSALEISLRSRNTSGAEK